MMEEAQSRFAGRRGAGAVRSVSYTPDTPQH